MSRTVLKFPFAFCPELGQKVTPEEVRIQKERYPNQKLTILCPDCELPFHYQHHKRKRLPSFASFKGRKEENHRNCQFKDAPLDKSSGVVEQRITATFKDIENYLELLNKGFESLEESWRYV